MICSRICICGSIRFVGILLPEKQPEPGAPVEAQEDSGLAWDLDINWDIRRLPLGIRLREIAADLSLRRNPVALDAVRRNGRIILKREEEEKLVLVLIEMPRPEDRAADQPPAVLKR